MWLISTTGITNTLGRVICGWISSYESVDPILLNNVSLTFGGFYTVILPLLPYSVFSYYLYASLFGFSMCKYCLIYTYISYIFLYVALISNTSILYLYENVLKTKN